MNHIEKSLKICSQKSYKKGINIRFLDTFICARDLYSLTIEKAIAVIKFCTCADNSSSILLRIRVCIRMTIEFEFIPYVSNIIIRMMS